MNKSGWLLFAALMVGSAPAGAAVITFDDLTTRDNFFDLGINNSYQGYVWSTTLVGGETDVTGWASATVADPASPPAPTPVSGTTYAWNWNGPQSLFIQFGAPTDVTSANFAHLSPEFGSGNSNTIQLFGYDATNTLVATGSVLQLSDVFQLYTANFSGVSTLEIRANTDSWFAVDDITLNANASEVPEPGSVFLMAAGGLALAGLRRFRAKN